MESFKWLWSDAFAKGKAREQKLYDAIDRRRAFVTDGERERLRRLARRFAWRRK